MNRRTLLALGAATLAAPRLACAQPAPPKIGFLYGGSRESAYATGRTPAFLEGMKKLGYNAGQNFQFEERYSDGSAGSLNAALRELLDARVALLVVTGSNAVHEARRATSTVPIIATVTSDPVGQGIAASLARPGGNVTGLYDSSLEIMGKQLQLLLTAAPKVRTIGVFMRAENPTHEPRVRVLEAAGQKLGVAILRLPVREAKDLGAAFVRLGREPAGGIVVLGDTFLVQLAPRIAELAAERKLPSISLTRSFPAVGGLMSYGEDVVDNFRRAATYVDKILRGAAPGDLPFERSMRIELTLNLKTAQKIGMRIPAEMMLQAAEVIE